MTYRTKYSAAAIIALACVLAMVRGLWLLIGDGLGGHISKLGVALLLAGFIVGMPVGIAYYYYQARRGDDKTREQVAVETLAQLGRRPKPQKNKIV